MGSRAGEGDDDEQTRHPVTIASRALAKFEVTFQEWERAWRVMAVRATEPERSELGAWHQAVINVSWSDAKNMWLGCPPYRRTTGC